MREVLQADLGSYISQSLLPNRRRKTFLIQHGVLPLPDRVPAGLAEVALLSDWLDAFVHEPFMAECNFAAGVDAVTTDAVLTVARDLLATERIALTILGPLDGIKITGAELAC